MAICAVLVAFKGFGEFFENGDPVDGGNYDRASGGDSGTPFAIPQPKHGSDFNGNSVSDMSTEFSRLPRSGVSSTGRLSAFFRFTMRLRDFRMFAGRFVRSRSTSRRGSSFSHNARTLCFESLDPRCLLTATLGDVPEPAVAEVANVCHPEPAPLEVAASTPLASEPTDAVFAEMEPVYLPAPVSADAPLAAPLDAAAEPAEMVGAEGEGPQTYPITNLEIVNVNFEFTPYGWLFSGNVAITGTWVPGIKVKFDGLFEATASVQVNGFFHHVWHGGVHARGDLSLVATYEDVNSEVYWVTL